MAVRRDIVANYIGQGATSVLGIAFVPMYIRYLTVEAYGLVGLFAVVQVWMSLLDLGMTPTLGREMALFRSGARGVQAIRDLLRSLELLFGGIAVVIAVGTIVATPYLASHWINRGHLAPATVRHSLMIMSLVVGMRFCEGIYRSALIGLQQQVWFNSAGVALAGLRAAGAIFILAVVSPTLEAFFLWQVVISLLTLGLFAAKVHFSLPRATLKARFSRDELVRVRQFAGGMFALSLLAVMLTQIDKLLLFRLLPLDQFGIYMLASTVTGAIYLIVGPVAQAIYPAFIRLFSAGDERHLAATYHAAAQLVSVVLTAPVALLAAYPQAILFVWSNDAALSRRTAPLLAVLAVGTFLNGLMHVPYQLQLASGWTGLSIRANILAVLVLMPALFWAVPRYGAVSAAIVWLVLNAGYIVAVMPIMHRRLLRGALRAWYVNDVGLPIAGAVAVLGPALLIRPDAVGDRLTWLLFLVVAGGCALTVSLLLTATMRRQLVSAARTIIARSSRVRGFGRP